VDPKRKSQANSAASLQKRQLRLPFLFQHIFLVARFVIDREHRGIFVHTAPLRLFSMARAGATVVSGLVQNTITFMCLTNDNTPPEIFTAQYRRFK
jgi:hypothetical protein